MRLPVVVVTQCFYTIVDLVYILSVPTLSASIAIQAMGKII